MSEQQSWGRTVLGWIIFFGLVNMVFWAVGIGPGFAGLIHMLRDGGVFQDHCHGHHKHCDAQVNLLSRVGSLTLVLLNASAVVCGVIVDAIGPRKAGIVSLIIWTVFTSIIGIAPANGVAFSIGFIGQACSSVIVFLAIMGEFIQGSIWVTPLIPSEAFGRSVLTGTWDLASVTFPIVSAIYFALGPPLWVVFVVYAGLIGLPSVAFLLTVYPPCARRSDIQQKCMPRLRGTFCSALKMLRMPFFWLLMFHTVVPVGYGYFVITSVIQHMKWRGASPSQARQYNTAFSFMLPAIGTLVAIAAAIFLRSVNRTKMMLLVGLNAVIILFAVAVLATPAASLQLNYLGFALLISWRMLAFVILNCFIFEAFPELPMISYALIPSICGLIGIGLNQIALTLVVHGSEDIFFPLVHSLYGLVGIVSELVMLIAMPILLDARGRSKKYSEAVTNDPAPDGDNKRIPLAGDINTDSRYDL